jgi:hypothetical protein
MGAASDKTFKEYLEDIGLSDEDKPETKHVSKDEALKKAESILELARKKGK